MKILNKEIMISELKILVSNQEILSNQRWPTKESFSLQILSEMAIKESKITVEGAAESTVY